MFIALLIATLMLGQVAEAFTCSSESVATEVGVIASVDPSANEKQSTSKGEPAGICHHGHCHQTLRLAEPAALPAANMVAASHIAFGHDAAIADGRVYTIDYPPRA